MFRKVLHANTYLCFCSIYIIQFEIKWNIKHLFTLDVHVCVCVCGRARVHVCLKDAHSHLA